MDKIKSKVEAYYLSAEPLDDGHFHLVQRLTEKKEEGDVIMCLWASWTSLDGHKALYYSYSNDPGNGQWREIPEDQANCLINLWKIEG